MKETRQASKRKWQQHDKFDDDFKSRFYVVAPEGKVYAWVVMKVRNEPTEDLANALEKGYTPVPADRHPELNKTYGIRSKIMREGKPEDENYIIKGDQILMEVDQDIWDTREARRNNYNKQIEEKIDWASQGSRIRAPTFVNTAKGSRTSRPAVAFEGE